MKRLNIRQWTGSAALAICLLATTSIISLAQEETLPGSLAAERARLAELTGDTSLRGRAAPKSLAALIPLVRRIPGVRTSHLFLVPPELRLTWNSALPYSINDGAMWAGRGMNLSAGGGLGIERDYRGTDIRVVIAPTAFYSENRAFQVRESGLPGRSRYASPFHGGEASMDVPLRFGDRYLLGLEPGRSSVTIRRGAVLVGVTSENEWWGPGIRNTLMMSNSARGIPRAFVSTASPVRTRFGTLDAKLIAGTLTESQFFDYNSGNDYRAISGLRVQLRPVFDTTLTIGIARVVYTTVPLSFSGTMRHALDVFTRWEYITSIGDTASNGRSHQRSDQIGSVWARWIFPASGFEVYGEYARMDLPRSGTELLTAPYHTGGYTLGLQWAQHRRRRDYLRLQSEVTYLEQSLVFPDRPPPDFYSGRATPQGYTNRGQVIGAAIGPGASSQWIALDYLAPAWQAGWFVGRIRWDNNALYRQIGANFFSHDVTVLTGLRGGWRSALSDVSLEGTFGYRFNYLFQYGGGNPGGFRTVDVRNFTLALVLSPAAH